MGYIYHFYATFVEEDDSFIELDGVIEASNKITTPDDYDMLKKRIATSQGVDDTDGLVLQNLSLLYTSDTCGDFNRNNALLN